MSAIAELKPGDAVRIGLTATADTSLLRELLAMRLLPGETVTVVAVAGRRGPVVVEGAGGVFALGGRLAVRLLGADGPE